MLRPRSRTLTIALVGAALTLFGAGGAFAAGDGPGGAAGGTHALCSTPGSPLATTPACTPAQQPPGQRAVETSGSGVAPAQPADGNGDHGDAPGPPILCEGGNPLTGSAVCPKPASR